MRTSSAFVARVIASVTGCVTLLACTAMIDGKALPGQTQNSGTSTGAGASPGAPSDGETTAACVEGASFAPARLLLISDEQYRNIVRDAFQVTIPADVIITAPPSTSGSYPYNESAQIQTTTVQAYQRAADQVALLLPKISTCTGDVNATCVEQFLRSTLPLAWRRPPTDDEIAGLLAIFASGAPDGSTRQIQLVIEAALLHPAFLYRAEIGENAAAATTKIPLTPYQLASALGFALFNSTPDTELLARAQDGTLTDPKVLSAQVTRLLALPAVRANLMKKVSYYLDFETLPFIQKDAATYPDFAALQPTLYQSSQQFLSDILWDGKFADLFTSRRIYANEPMAKAYGLPAVSGSALQSITLQGDSYNGGILTQPALLAASDKNAVGDDVIHRGLWVYYNLLCAPTLPPPPANAASVAATITGSTREQAHTRDTTCGGGCHGRFDPFGLVTLGYDGIGRYRTTDPTSTPPGALVDASASVPPGILNDASSTDSVELSGVADVAARFATDRRISDCATVNLSTYTLDHNPTTGNSCDLKAVQDRFQQSGSFADLFTAILTSKAFLTRDP